MVPHLEQTELIIFVVAAGAAAVYMWALIKDTQKKQKRIDLHAVDIELTFAGLGSLKPHVTNVSVAGASAILIPSTARSATTDSAGLYKISTFWARHCIRCGDV